MSLHGARRYIILSHKISLKGIEVDREKIAIIEQIRSSISVKEVRSFFGHLSFYLMFIKDFSKVFKPLCNILEKDLPFKFDDKFLEAFQLYKRKTNISINNIGLEQIIRINVLF